MYDYLVNTRKNIGLDPVEFSITSDFCESDVEQYEQTFEVLSELEEKRIEVFRDFIVDPKPLLRKGIVESLKYSSDLQISDEELSTIYTLLGYFSTKLAVNFYII